MTNTHTPGPWEALNRGYKHHVTSQDAGAFYAEICGPHHEANARLIAAAPDLLAALQICAKELRKISSNVLMNPAYQKARAAIAKAEGRE